MGRVEGAGFGRHASCEIIRKRKFVMRVVRNAVAGIIYLYYFGEEV